jgi:hypothetical protein
MQQFFKGLSPMAQAVFDCRLKLGGTAVMGGNIKDRIITKSVFTLGLV